MARPNLTTVNAVVHTGPVADREFTQYSDGVCEATIGGVVLRVAADGTTMTAINGARAAGTVSVTTKADLLKVRASK